MTDVYRIPLVAKAQQINIFLAGNEYTIVCKWNEQIGWVLDITDTATQSILVACLPVVTGCNLLQQYTHLDIGGQLIAATVGGDDTPPTYENLGSESGLFFTVFNG